MRPPVPPPDTPNEGRQKRYASLVEPYTPEKRQKREHALVGAVAGVVGAVLMVAAEVGIRAFS